MNLLFTIYYLLFFKTAGFQVAALTKVLLNFFIFAHYQQIFDFGKIRHHSSWR